MWKNSHLDKKRFWNPPEQKSSMISEQPNQLSKRKQTFWFLSPGLNLRPWNTWFYPITIWILLKEMKKSWGLFKMSLFRCIWDECKIFFTYNGPEWYAKVLLSSDYTLFFCSWQRHWRSFYDENGFISFLNRLNSLQVIDYKTSFLKQERYKSYSIIHTVWSEFIQ